MPVNVRAFFAVMTVALCAFGGAMYLGHEHAVAAGGGGSAGPAVQSSAPGGARQRISVVADELTTLLGGPQDQRLLDTAFRKVEDVYYKPVTAQTLLNGERKGLVAFLQHHHVRDPAIPAAQATGDQSEDTAVLNRNLRAAIDAYGKKFGDTELTQAAMSGMLGALGDPYTTYLSPKEINSLEESLDGGDFGGIGVYIVQDPKTKEIVVDPIEGTPADRSGVKPGDVIIAVNGRSVKDLSLDAVERLIRGKSGTVVALTVHPHNSTAKRRISVTREIIHVPSVHAKIEGKYDYIRLADFGKTSGEEVRRALLNGKRHHVQGYILDLRNNGGGLLDAAVDVSSLFIQDGTIVSMIGRSGTIETRDALHDAVGAKPLVVLVNKYTASASEITAGAIQDDKVGELIGTRTFGKGVVQTIYNMPNGSGALKITTSRYVTPLGRDIQHKGIMPDIVVDQPVDLGYIDTPKDRQLAAAKAYLSRHPSGE